MKIDDLKPNELNPRKMSADRRKLLKSSLDKYGDLSGIIYNVRDKKMYGGHQRRSVLKGATVKITEQLEKANKQGTVARGWILSGDEKFAYRQVDWSPEKAAEAMIAANKIHGEWDADILKVAVESFPKMDLASAGLEKVDFENWGLDMKMPKDVPVDVPVSEGSEEVTEPEEETDEQYVKNTEQTTEQVDTQSFDNTNEETKIANKRFVIIIDCPNEEVKESWKEKLRPELDQAGCKIF